MISGKKLIGTMIVSFLIALLGMVLMVVGVEIGKFLTYSAFPVCAITILVGSIGTMIGKVEKDF